MRSASTGLRLVLLTLLLAISVPWSAYGQDSTGQPGGDAPAEPPPAATAGPRAGAMNFCDVSELALSRGLALQSEEVAWRVTGLLPGTRVSPRVIEAFAPTGASTTQLGSALVSNQCEAMATFLAGDLGPGTYTMTLIGTMAWGGPVEVTATFSIVASSRPPALTPTPRPFPTAPGGLRASPVSANTVRLDWADNSNNETGFRIDSDAGQFRTSPNITTYNVGGLQPSAIYCFSVYAFNDAGESYGGTSCAFTPALPR